jgi:hypothetical protein
MSTYEDTKTAAAQKSEDTKNTAQVMHAFLCSLAMTVFPFMLIVWLGLCVWLVVT